MANRLMGESSPYLLQHADNPVDWYPWGDEAFAAARAMDRPIFLSVGYSTCHWCHVMEHESFADPAIASVLNEHFVSIKVDREERPDVDRVYMTFVQATTGSGGWPMSIWLTPDLEPIVGGTYFPPTSRWGRPGFVEVLQQIDELWRTDRDRLVTSAQTVTERLREAVAPPSDGVPTAVPAVAGQQALRDAVESFRTAYDVRYAGFGDAPKFPRPSELLFLLREHARTRDEDPREMVLQTLRAMALGGMRDHLGGGFHRYSVDARWRVPHFEKMLYDQAQLVLAYLEAVQASGDGFYAAVADDTLEYVQRELTDKEGGFFSAEDADSVPPESVSEPDTRKTEGAFYLWSEEELNRLLGADEAAIVRARYGTEPSGNVPEDPHGEFGAKNILYVAMSVEDVAARERRSQSEVDDVLRRARSRLFAARAERPRPHLDDKVLTAWNGLMIAAFARAARVSPAIPGAEDRAARYAAAGERAARFVLTRLWDESRQVLCRRYRDGNAAIDGYCEDYAYTIWGLLELFQATGAAEWLTWARTLQARQDALFWDAVNGGWFGTTGEDPSVLLRLKEDYDGAEPAPSSVAVLNLMTLAHLAADADALQKVELTLARGGEIIGRAARAVPFMMANLSAYHAGIQQAVIVGPRDRQDTLALVGTTASVYQPFTVVVPVTPEEQPKLAELLPFIAPMTMRDGRATAYVCRNFTCEAPVTDPEQLRQALGGEGGPPLIP
ncbi:MAG: DUF255 domain-containing protein [Luteitalea sp.]|nr:DUF255 domain-containing protein [Luteitalea sp.]